MKQALRSLAVQLCAVGLVGVVLAAAVLWSALVGFGNVRESVAAAKLISQAQRYHQDGDMAHDALHADVLGSRARERRTAAARPRRWRYCGTTWLTSERERGTSSPGPAVGRAGDEHVRRA